MIAPKKGLACHGRVTRISNTPEKWGSSSMRRQSVPGSFLKKRLGTRLEDEERSEFQVLHQDMALYARINCQNKFVAPDELPAVQAASESMVARVQTSAADGRQRISAF